MKAYAIKISKQTLPRILATNVISIADAQALVEHEQSKHTDRYFIYPIPGDVSVADPNAGWTTAGPQYLDVWIDDWTDINTDFVEFETI